MNERDFQIAIARNIKSIRERLGITQKELGIRVGATATTISSIEGIVKAVETNKNTSIENYNLFPLKKLPKYLKALKCTPEELLSPLFEAVEKDEYLLQILEKVKRIYHVSGGRIELEKELHKIELLLGESGKVPFEKGKGREKAG